LDRFRSAILDEYPVRKWTSPAELGGLVSRSLVREIKVNPRPGWIRNDGTSPISLLEKISNLSDENQTLRYDLAQFEISTPDDSLQQGLGAILLRGTRRLRSKRSHDYAYHDWEYLTTWDAIFADMGPVLLNEATEVELKDVLARFHSLQDITSAYEHQGRQGIFPENWNEVLIQFRALNYMEPGTKKRGVNDANRYWKITQAGDRHLVSLLARKRS
jgi:hypothetical protein